MAFKTVGYTLPESRNSVSMYASERAKGRRRRKTDFLHSGGEGGGEGGEQQEGSVIAERSRSSLAAWMGDVDWYSSMCPRRVPP